MGMAVLTPVAVMVDGEQRHIHPGEAWPAGADKAAEKELLAKGAIKPAAPAKKATTKTGGASK